MSDRMRRIHRIHFVGIGGSGMSGIAEVLVNLGYDVQGSDIKANAVTQRLQALGATIVIGHAAENIANADVVVVSSAVGVDNPEVVAANARRLPVVQRAEMLAEIMRFRYGIAIAGTHGKTTTTSMVASLLAEGGLDPTFVIGGRLKSAGSNARLGAGKYLVAEADESDASFKQLQPMIAIVTNVDADHMATHNGDFEQLKQSFIDFLHNLPFYGLAVICADDVHAASLLPRIGRPVLTYGITSQADLRATNIERHGMQSTFDVMRAGHAPLSVRVNLPGTHNVLNALAAIAVAMELEVPDAAIQSALANFQGIDRRLQQYGDVQTPNGRITLVDDYGHHPTEIAATLEAVRQGWAGRRILLVFQPHRYTRTHDLLDDFARVLATTDALVVTEVFAAGEAPITGADGKAICRAVRSHGRVEPVFVEKVEQLSAALARIVQDGDVVVTMGAGSIGSVPSELTHSLATPVCFGGEECMMALKLPPDFSARVLRNESLAKHTSWRVGGPADIFFKPLDAQDLAAFLRTLDVATPILWIGLGSNLLVRDGGVRGVVIATHGAFGDIHHLNATDVWAGSGVTCAKLAKQCAKLGLGAAEFFAGIPGTVGGALAMNAGAFGGETWRHVVEVETIDRNGDIRRRRSSDYVTSYRHVEGPRDEWFLGAQLHFESTDVSEDGIRQLLARRKATQPIGELSCGSVFTNPPGDHAARLIEAAGLKDFRIGGASVSVKHANFIINDGHASAQDIERVIEQVRTTVANKFGVSLQPEVRMVGDAHVRQEKDTSERDARGRDNP